MTLVLLFTVTFLKAHTTINNWARLFMNKIVRDVNRFSSITSKNIECFICQVYFTSWWWIDRYSEIMRELCTRRLTNSNLIEKILLATRVREIRIVQQSHAQTHCFTVSISSDHKRTQFKTNSVLSALASRR